MREYSVCKIGSVTRKKISGNQNTIFRTLAIAVSHAHCQTFFPRFDQEWAGRIAGYLSLKYLAETHHHVFSGPP